jgi:hypothetical protein
MRRSRFVLGITVVTALLPFAVPRAVHAQQLPSAAPSRLDSLTAQLVELELQRVSLLSNPSSAVAAPGDAAAGIAALHAQLRALPEGAAAERQAMSRVILALDARASTLRDRVRALRLVYTEGYPVVRQALDEEQAIGKRVTEIRNAK